MVEWQKSVASDLVVRAERNNSDHSQPVAVACGDSVVKVIKLDVVVEVLLDLPMDYLRRV